MRLQQSWIENDPLGAFYSVSANGWTDNEIGVEWLRNVFDPQTKHRHPGEPRLLILDGHGSHLTYYFVKYARENDIIILCFPAHATAMLQALDLVIFSVLSRAWTEVLERELVGGLFMRKMDFTLYVIIGHFFTP